MIRLYVPSLFAPKIQRQTLELHKKENNATNVISFTAEVKIGPDSDQIEINCSVRTVSKLSITDSELIIFMLSIHLETIQRWETQKQRLTRKSNLK